MNDDDKCRIKIRKITDSNISDLLNDQIRSRKTFNPRGWLQFTETLKELLNVSNNLIGNPRRLNITTGSIVGGKRKPTASYAPKKRGGYRDLCKSITIHRILEERYKGKKVKRKEMAHFSRHIHLTQLCSQIVH